MLHSLKQMRVQMRERLPYVPLTNEAAHRAFYVTPLLFAALDHFRFKGQFLVVRSQFSVFSNCNGNGVTH